ncbi:MAG TPA: hypothetical protein PLZ62_01875 [bacterium]|nr:hypothetical protein [bacterium]
MSISALKESDPNTRKIQEIFEDFDIYQKNIVEQIRKENNHISNNTSDDSVFNARLGPLEAKKYGFVDELLTNRILNKDNSEYSKGPDYQTIHDAEYIINNHKNSLLEGIYEKYDQYAEHLVKNSNYLKNLSQPYNHKRSKEFFDSEKLYTSKCIEKYHQYKNLIGYKGDKYFRKEALSRIEKGASYPILTINGMNLIDANDAGLISIEKDNGHSVIKFEEENLFTDRRNLFLEDVHKLRLAYSAGIIKNRKEYLSMVKNSYIEHKEKKNKQEKLDKLQEIFEQSPDKTIKKETGSHYIEKKFPQIKNEFEKIEIKEKIKNIVEISIEKIDLSATLNLDRESNPEQQKTIELKMSEKQNDVVKLENEQKNIEKSINKLHEELAKTESMTQDELHILNQPISEDIKDIWQQTIRTKQFNFNLIYKRLFNKQKIYNQEIEQIHDSQSSLSDQIEVHKNIFEKNRIKLNELKKSIDDDKMFILSEVIIDLKNSITQNIVDKESEGNISPYEKTGIELYVIDELSNNYKKQQNKLNEINILSNCKKTLQSKMKSFISPDQYEKIGSLFEIGKTIGEYCLDERKKLTNIKKLEKFFETFDYQDYYLLSTTIKDINSRNFLAKISDLYSIISHNKSADMAYMSKNIISGIKETIDNSDNKAKKITFMSFEKSELNEEDTRYFIEKMVPRFINSRNFQKAESDMILNIRQQISTDKIADLDKAIIENLQSRFDDKEDLAYNFYNNTDHPTEGYKLSLLNKILDKAKIEKYFEIPDANLTLEEINKSLELFADSENISPDNLNNLFSKFNLIATHITPGSEDIIKSGGFIATSVRNVCNNRHFTDKTQLHASFGFHNTLNSVYGNLNNSSSKKLVHERNSGRPTFTSESYPSTFLVSSPLSWMTEKNKAIYEDLSNWDGKKINDVPIRGASTFDNSGKRNVPEEHIFKIDKMVLFAPSGLKIDESTGAISNQFTETEWKQNMILGKDNLWRDKHGIIHEKPDKFAITSEEYFQNIAEKSSNKPKYIHFYKKPEDLENINLLNHLLDWKKQKNISNIPNYKNFNLLMSVLRKKELYLRDKATISPSSVKDVEVEYSKHNSHMQEGWGNYYQYEYKKEEKLTLNQKINDSINNSISLTTFRNYQEIYDQNVHGGNTPGGHYKINEVLYDKEYYLKFANSPDEESRLWNEQLTDNIYRKLGIDVPETEIVNFQDAKGDIKLARASHWIERSNTVDQTKFNQGFLADCLLANWDANLNKIEGKDGKVYRIDNGGSLLFRARGERKKLSRDFDSTNDQENYGILWEDRVPEIDSMRNRGIYNGLTRVDIESQISNIEQNLTNDDIERLTYTVKMELNDRKLLQDIICKRRNYLINNKQQILAKFPE